MSGQTISTSIAATATLLFSFRGRLNVRQFWRAIGLQMMLAVLPLISFSFSAWAAASIVVLPVVAWSAIAVQVKRAHDLGHAGTYLWHPLSGFNIAFKAGQSRANVYGPPPAA